MRWRIVAGEQLLGDAAGVWQQACEQHAGAHPLLDLKFVQPLLKYFGDGAERLAVADGVAGPDAVALVQKGGRMRWDLFLPAQAAMGALIVRPDLDAAACASLLRGLIRGLPGRAGQLGLLKIDPLLWDPGLLAHSGIAEIATYAQTSNVAVDGDGFEAFWSSRKKNVRQQVNRSIRRLSEAGTAYALKVVARQEDIPAAVAEYGRIESSGWKRTGGTAISDDNLQGRFYTEVLERFAALGQAHVFQLCFDGEAVASLLTVSQAGMMVVLKTTYDEAHANFGPGRLLDYLMLEHVFGDSAWRVLENYTNATREDMKWCTGARPIYHVGVYRSVFARQASALARRLHRLGKPSPTHQPALEN